MGHGGVEARIALLPGAGQPVLQPVPGHGDGGVGVRQAENPEHGGLNQRRLRVKHRVTDDAQLIHVCLPGEGPAPAHSRRSPCR
ncbi:hypothetical protein SDC9_128195 [bioreactor metagenome]|uniref:Uncharacterized protein n=1 Tax=bioreactor metagenome TaxID=1076179 RepID=A0A645CW91_9ZZZZ